MSSIEATAEAPAGEVSATFRIRRRKVAGTVQAASATCTVRGRLATTARRHLGKSSVGLNGRKRSRSALPSSGKHRANHATMSSMAGELITETFGYDGGRQVTVYLPAGRPEAVVFAGDGQVIS